MRRAIAAVAILLILAACKDAGSAGPPPGGATVPTAAPTTTTTNPYAVPSVIDSAYVNRVLAGLDTQFGDAFRLVFTGKSVSPEAIDRLRAMYANLTVMNLQLQAMQDGLRRNFSGYASPPGNKRTTVSELIVASPGCIYAEVSRDYSAVVNPPSPPPNKEWVAMKPADSTADPFGYNSTKWAFLYEGAEGAGIGPRTPPCVASP